MKKTKNFIILFVSLLTCFLNSCSCFEKVFIGISAIVIGTVAAPLYLVYFTLLQCEKDISESCDHIIAKKFETVSEVYLYKFNESKRIVISGNVYHPWVLTDKSGNLIPNREHLSGFRKIPIGTELKISKVIVDGDFFGAEGCIKYGSYRVSR